MSHIRRIVLYWWRWDFLTHLDTKVGRIVPENLLDFVTERAGLFLYVIARGRIPRIYSSLHVSENLRTIWGCFVDRKLPRSIQIVAI